jgi:hypothetical protein
MQINHCDIFQTNASNELSSIFLASERGYIRFNQQKFGGDLDVEMPKMNDAEIVSATQGMGECGFAMAVTSESSRKLRSQTEGSRL